MEKFRTDAFGHLMDVLRSIPHALCKQDDRLDVRYVDHRALETSAGVQAGHGRACRRPRQREGRNAPERLSPQSCEVVRGTPRPLRYSAHSIT